jgi:hypothetical protein
MKKPRLIDISPKASRPTTGKDDHVGHVLFEMDGSCLEMENTAQPFTEGYSVPSL